MSAEFTLGGEQSEHVRVVVLGRAHPSALDYWDGNWLTAEVYVAAGPWRGAYGADLRADEFKDFRDRLQLLYDDAQAPPAVFATLEASLELSVTRPDRLGHIQVRGTAGDESVGRHNTLHFAIDLDQSYLPATLAGLNEITESFPIVGSPPDPGDEPPPMTR